MIPKNISMFYQEKEPITSESLLSNNMNNIHKINQIEERKNSENQKMEISNNKILPNQQIQNYENQIKNFIEINEIEIKKEENNKIKRIKCMHDISKTGMSGDEKKVNQDTYFIFKNFGNSFENIYMGVCDGHGYYGHEVSGYIRENLPMDLNHMIKAKKLKFQIIKYYLIKKFNIMNTK